VELKTQQQEASQPTAAELAINIHGTIQTIACFDLQGTWLGIFVL
jgi:hypothetical protein